MSGGAATASLVAARGRGERVAIAALALVGAKLGMGIFALWMLALDRVATAEGDLLNEKLLATVLQTLLYGVVAVAIVRASKTGIAIAATYVGYGLAVLLARGAIGPFAAAALAIGAALLVALLMLRATDAAALRLRARGPWLTLAGGALTGALIGIAFGG